MPTRAVLFDFDGTLADSFEAITASVNHVRGKAGLPAMAEKEVRRYVGLGLDDLLTRLAPGLPPTDAAALYRQHHVGAMRESTKLFPGVLDTLTALHARGLKLAVCSNKAVRFTKELVQLLGLGGLIADSLGPEDAAGHAKPNPKMLFEACARLGVGKGETVYVGDMTVDVLAGRNAGITTWIVHPGQAGTDDVRDAHPDRVLGEFTDILTLIDAAGDHP